MGKRVRLNHADVFVLDTNETGQIKLYSLDEYAKNKHLRIYPEEQLFSLNNDAAIIRAFNGGSVCLVTPRYLKKKLTDILSPLHPHLVLLSKTGAIDPHSLKLIENASFETRTEINKPSRPESGLPQERGRLPAKLIVIQA